MGSEYTSWMYKKDETPKIFKKDEMDAAFENGWVLTPADLSDDGEKDHPQVVATIDKLASDANFLLNVDKCTRKEEILEFAETYLATKLDKNMSLKKLIAAVKKLASEKGML